MRSKIALLVTCAAIIGGCLPSVHQLYTDKDTIYDPNLEGTWAGDANSSDKWTLSRLPNSSSYALVYTDTNETSSFIANLIKLDGNLFMDIYPSQNTKVVQGDVAKWFFVPVHYFVKIQAGKNSVTYWLFKDEAIDQLFKNDPNVLKHERMEHGPDVLLTASTADLQKFMRKYGNDDKLFENAVTLIRIAPAAKKSVDSNSLSLSHPFPE